MPEKDHYETQNILKNIRDRKRVEMGYLDAVKRQLGYWKSQIEAINAQEDEERYNELQKNIESEKQHIKQILDELNRINQEIKMLQR